MNKTQKTLTCFLGLHFALWTVVAMIVSSLPMDTAEAIVWGGEWTFITNKHPYLSGWVAELFYQLFGGNARVAMAVLTAVCSTAAIWFVYRLARQFMDRSWAVVAALLLEGCVYYAACSLKYNCNVLSASLAPLFFWMAWRALKTDAWRHWVAMGLVAGALAMTKYSNGALLAGVAVYVLVWRRDVFRRPGVYLAAALCLVICLPHLIALLRTDFAMFDYVEGKAGVLPESWGHVRYPVLFLIGQMINSWGAFVLIAVALCMKRFKFEAIHPYLFCVGILPILAFPCFSAVTATPLKDMWGFAFASVFPVIAVAGLDSRPNVGRWLVRLAFVALGVQVLAMACVAVCHTSRSWLDVDALVRELPVKNPTYIGGEVWLCSEVALALESRPHVAYQMDFRKCPWIDRAEMGRSGFLILTDDPVFFEAMRKRYPGLQDVRAIPLQVKAPFGRQKPDAAYVGYMPPGQMNP